MTHHKSENTAARIIELDAQRGMAAVAVPLCHLPRGLWFGAAGTDQVFMLSGFLSTGIIMRNLDHPGCLRTFYWPRSLRVEGACVAVKRANRG